MAYCRKCGFQIDDEAVICPKCGVAQQQMRYNDGISGSSRSTNGIALLGMVIPLIGWMVYAMMDKSKPLAQDLLRGNIVGTIANPKICQFSNTKRIRQNSLYGLVAHAAVAVSCAATRVCDVLRMSN